MPCIWWDAWEDFGGLDTFLSKNWKIYVGKYIKYEWLLENNNKVNVHVTIIQNEHKDYCP